MPPKRTESSLTTPNVVNKFGSSRVLVSTGEIKVMMDYMCLHPGGGGGGGYLRKFNTGRLRPAVQPLTLLYTILAEKVPLLCTFLFKTYLLEEFLLSFFFFSHVVLKVAEHSFSSRFC